MRIAVCVVPGVLWLASMVLAAPAPEKTEGSLAETQRLLATRIDVDFTDMDAAAAFAQLGTKVPGLEIVLDPAVAEAGFDLSLWWVGFSARRIPVSEVLDFECGDELAWLAEAGRVRIVTREKYQADLTVVRYPVGLLLSRPPRKHSAALGRQELAELILRMINNQGDPYVAAWTEAGGPARISWTGNGFQISQTRRGHEQIAQFLAMLSSGLGLEPEVTPPETLEPIRQALAETRGLLEKPIDLDFEKTLFPDALEHLLDIRPGLNLVIDPYLSAVGITLSTRVLTLKVKGLPISVALDHVLGPGLRYRTMPGYVLIVPSQKAQPDLSTAIYPAGDFAGRWAGLHELVDIIKRNINNMANPEVASWSDEGGRAVIEFAADALVVSQTETGHRRMRQLLQGMRTVAALGLELPSRPRGPVPAVALPEDPHLVATLRALEMRIDVDFKDVPLGSALEEVAERGPRLNIIVRSVVFDSSPLDPAKRITLQRTGVTRKALLEEMIGEEHGIEVHGGYVRIALRGEVKPPPLPQVLYPVRDIWKDRHDLIDTIKQRVNHISDPNVAAWTDEGGPAAVDYMNYILIVTQTREGHEEINALLQNLRLQSRLAKQLP